MIAIVVALAPPAAGQTPQERDPEGSSPPGSVYELPAETGRGDASPGAPAKPDPGDSAIRNDDNGFGTSGEVPGVPSVAPPDPRPEPKRPERQNSDSGTTTPRPEPAPAPAVSTAATSGAGASPAAAYALLALAVLAAAGLGLAARRRSA